MQKVSQTGEDSMSADGLGFIRIQDGVQCVSRCFTFI